MVAPFFEPGSVFYNDDALFHALLGAPDPELEVVRPFFRRQEAATVSAVVYCNQFTVMRFLRLAIDLTAPNAPRLIRSGTCYQTRSADEYALRHFEHIVGEEGTPTETWAEGVTIFENPFAHTPLPRDFLPASCHVSVQENYVYREIRGFHPVVSFTRIEISPAAFEALKAQRGL